MLFNAGKHVEENIYYNLGRSHDSSKELNSKYRKVASTSLSYFEAHAGLFRLSMKGIFNDYVL